MLVLKRIISVFYVARARLEDSQHELSKAQDPELEPWFLGLRVILSGIIYDGY